MKKVLFINHCLSSGGSERAMTTIANYFAEHNVDVTMMLLDDEPKEYKLNDSVKVVECYCPVVGNKLLWQFKRLWTIRQAVRKCNPDTIVSFIIETNARVLMATLGLRKYIVQSERNDPGNITKKFDKIAMRTILKKANHTVFQTCNAREYYPEIVKTNSTVIPNAIRRDIPQLDRSKVEKKIVAVGRLAEQKNFKMLINAFDVFNKKIDGYKLIIYGDGPLRTSLELQIRELNLEDKVIMPGYINNVNEEMKNASMYVSSSNYEGISNAMLEALAMGIPTICTDCPVGGAAEIIDNNENGILVEVGDVNSLAEEMIRIATDSDFADRLSYNAVKVREEYSIDRIGQMWLKVCKI